MRVAVASDHDRCPLGQPAIVLPQRHTVAARQIDQLPQGPVAQLRIGRVGDRPGLHGRVDHHPFEIAARQRPALVRSRQALLDQRRELALAEPPPSMRQRRAVERQPVAEAQFAAEELVIRVLQPACAQPLVRQPTGCACASKSAASPPAGLATAAAPLPGVHTLEKRRSRNLQSISSVSRTSGWPRSMMSSNAGRNRSRCRSSRGFATCAPHADDPPPVAMIRSIRRNENRRKPPSKRYSPANWIIAAPRVALPGQPFSRSSQTTR
jgi:hypothetical protein